MEVDYSTHPSITNRADVLGNNMRFGSLCYIILASTTNHLLASPIIKMPPL